MYCNSHHSIKGQMMVLFAAAIVALAGLLAISVEVGHIFVIKNELQNAADAAAHDGAAYLFPSASGTGLPNWTTAQTNSLTAVKRNKVGGLALTNGTIAGGWWDTTRTTTTLKPTSNTPGPNDVPAIQVTISRSAGQNGGPVSLFFGSILGLSTVNLSASAVAASGSPSTVNANTLFPVGMAQGLYNTYWDSTTNQPKIDPSTGQPYIFQINSGPNGGWSTFLTQTNSSPSIISLINSGNPAQLSIGQNIWFPSGVKTDVYSNVPTNVNVMVAVAAQTTPGNWSPIVAFAPLHIISAAGGSSKYIQVQFLNNFKFTQGTMGGGYYGAYMPPRIVD